MAKDVSGRFNAALDFFQLVVNCHIIAATLHYFGMKDVKGTPVFNALPSSILQQPIAKQWSIFSDTIGRLVDRYVIVHRFTDLHPEPSCPRPLVTASSGEIQSNPHAIRVNMEHSYACGQPVRDVTRKRSLPSWLRSLSDRPVVSHNVIRASPDGVFEYARAVLNDGLLLMEFRDAIKEGDGDRIMRCWKFMLPYFHATGHTKYRLEAFNLLASVHATASPRLSHQIMWSRTVNTQGHKGHNVPIDLQMEHLNRSLKDTIIGLGANVTERSVVQSAKALKGIIDVTEHFDQICGVVSGSIQHTRKSDSKDQAMVLEQLTTKSHVFDYIPGRQHHSTSFSNLNASITEAINAQELFSWISTQKVKLSKYIQLQNVLGR